MPAVGHARGKALAATHLAVLKVRRSCGAVTWMLG
jgi:hypothetical protein